MSPRYAETPADWDKVARVLNSAPYFGWDSETDGHDVQKSTPAFRARVHVWSVAVPTSSVHPRGHKIAVGMVLPEAALEYRPIREALENPANLKPAHNSPHDEHTFLNYGIRVANVVNTLPLAKLHYRRQLRHGLDALCHIINREKRKFKEVLSMPRMVEVKKVDKTCVCGDLECKESARLKAHRRIKTEYFVMEQRGMQRVELRDVTPGHPLWEPLVDYALEDAVMAAELLSHMWDVVGDAKPPWVEWGVL